MKGIQIPCYHGTNTKKKVQAIMRNGFKDGTYWARHMEDALEFGGKYIFEVMFDEYEINGGWQFTSMEVAPDKIEKLFTINHDNTNS